MFIPFHCGVSSTCPQVLQGPRGHPQAAAPARRARRRQAHVPRLDVLPAGLADQPGGALLGAEGPGGASTADAPIPQLQQTPSWYPPPLCRRMPPSRAVLLRLDSN